MKHEGAAARLERRLDGPGSEARLLRLQKRFHAVSKGLRLAPTRRADPGRLGLTLWLTAWATCVGVGLYLLLAHFVPGGRLGHAASQPDCTTLDSSLDRAAQDVCAGKVVRR